MIDLAPHSREVLGQAYGHSIAIFRQSVWTTLSFEHNTRRLFETVLVIGTTQTNGPEGSDLAKHDARRVGHRQIPVIVVA